LETTQTHSLVFILTADEALRLITDLHLQAPYSALQRSEVSRVICYQLGGESRRGKTNLLTITRVIVSFEAIKLQQTFSLTV
jgi:hypothetical protein